MKNLWQKKVKIKKERKCEGIKRKVNEKGKGKEKEKRNGKETEKGVRES